MSSRIEQAVSAVLAVGVVLVAGATVHAEFFVTRPPAVSMVPAPPRRVANWAAMEAAGVNLGDSTAPVKIVEFGDLECPFCRAFQSRLNAVERRHPAQVATVFVHLPLSVHKFALAAAQAAECAGDQGQFGSFINAVYAGQDSLGLKSWTEFATTAGVRDTSRLADCVRVRHSFPRIDRDLSLANSNDVHSTPTIVINGWRFAAPPSESALDSAIVSLLAQRTPPR